MRHFEPFNEPVLSNDIGKDIALYFLNLVFQKQFFLFEPLNLQKIDRPGIHHPVDFDISFFVLAFEFGELFFEFGDIFHQ